MDEEKRFFEPEEAAPAISPEEFDQQTLERILRVGVEFKKGFDFIKDHPKSVTIFGSARFKEDCKHYAQARELAGRLSAQGYAVLTGGGPGIMEAANRGAQETDGNEHSLGLNIKLPHEQHANPYITQGIDFHYFFTRKVLLSYAAEAYIYFPGGFGTLDEFFEVLTLVQTKKIPPVPIILVGDDYWKPLDGFIKDNLLDKHNAINAEDRDLYTITEDFDKIEDIVKNAPVRYE
jgi:uncharacterized protein (TIGR00730 family)